MTPARSWDIRAGVLIPVRCLCKLSTQYGLCSSVVVAAYGNDAALEKFDVGPIEEKLSFSEATLQERVTLSTWHDKALN